MKPNMDVVSYILSKEYTDRKFKSSSGVDTTIKVGSTKTGAPGTDAVVTNSGTDKDVILDFTIPRGDAGHTPVKGTDYWTDADKTEIVNSVLAALPSAEGVSF